MPRCADLDISIGLLPSGPTASIHDVPGVGVGHATVWRDEPDPPDGRGIARTGVTVVHPGGNVFREPVPAGGAVLNGAGECTGFIQTGEWGFIETPIFLTSTMQVGRVYDAACELLMDDDPGMGEDGNFVIPVVAECDDSFLNNARCMQVAADDVRAAHTKAKANAGSGQPPDEGSVGAGTGMHCLGWKGGIGTASRIVPSGHTVGVLLLTNFGELGRLTIDGIPAGQLLPPPPPRAKPAPAGSCIGVVLTDAPIDHAGCERMARRVGLGLARTGSTGHHGSGEIFLAAANGLRAPRDGRAPSSPLIGDELNPYFAAVVEATEEAVLNSMLMSPTVAGHRGHVEHGIPVDDLRRLLGTRAGRLRA